MKIQYLARGGLAVYAGSYDPRRRVAIASDDQQQTVVITYPATITAVALTENGIDAGTAAVSGSQATFTISGSGSLSIIATMGDERPKVVIEAESSGTDGYGET